LTFKNQEKKGSPFLVSKLLETLRAELLDASLIEEESIFCFLFPTFVPGSECLVIENESFFLKKTIKSEN